jgi:hypothetical protein
MRPPVSACVKMIGGRPTLLLDGRPEAPLLYALTDAPGSRWSWEEVPSRNIALFGASGCRLFQADIWIEQLLAGDGPLDITPARRQVAGILAACPEAFVMLRVHVNAPPQWCEANPPECVGYADTPATPEARRGLERWVGRDNEAPVRASLNSGKWRAWASARLAEFCAALAAAPEGAAVFAIQVACGVYGEWHQFGFFCHDADTGEAAQAAFRRWLGARYGTDAALARAWSRPGARLADAVAPGSPEREETALAIFRDPVRRRDVIDYYTFLHEGLADAILLMARTVRESWPRPVVTASFYGYFYCLFGREAAGGHLALDRVLASPHLDCLCASPVYTPGALPLGGTGHSKGLLGAVRRAGKLWLDEMDRATSVSGCPWDKAFKSTIPDDVAVLRRNLLQPLTRGGGAWCYDFGPTAGTPEFTRLGPMGWWDDPDLQAAFSGVLVLARSRVGRPYGRPADVLLIHDPWSFAHTASARHDPSRMVFGVMPVSRVDPVSHLLKDGVVEALHRSGLIHEDALLSELGSLDLEPYRMVILATTPVLGGEARRLISEKVAAAGRHVVLLGYAGWGDGAAVGPELAARLGGLGARLRASESPEQTISVDGVTETLGLGHPFAVPAFEAPGAEVVGRWEDGSASAVGRTTDGATWWAFGLPPVQPGTWRALGRRAGCAVVNDHDDTTFLGDGLLVVHTVDGGERLLRPPGGKPFSATLPPRSTTVFELKAET